MREALLRGDDPDAVVARDTAIVDMWWPAVARYRLHR